MADSNSNSTVIVTLITVLGSIAVAVIGNWEKLTGTAHQESPPPPITTTVQPPTTSEPPVVIVEPPQPPQKVIDISGNWVNPDYPASAGSFISQQGNTFQYNGWGMLPQGIGYQVQGSGTIVAQVVTSRYSAQYQNGWVSAGTCSGTVTADGTRLTSTCTDNVLGTFVSSAVKQ